MKKLLKLLLFIPTLGFSCDQYNIVFESLKEIPIVKSGKVEKLELWGELPAQLNINDYEMLDLRVRAKSEGELAYKVMLLKNKKVLSSTEVKAKKSFANIGRGFGTQFQKARDEGATKLKIEVMFDKNKKCKKEVKLWPGD
ncbi:hypothetical protein [Bacteriovorax sp. DB6_IX]|uniref:hypothetical protein n=1 Tax=Bacteriovorax sp. DB6_IX TaxID=1353530 RepID=UPI00038A010E|nr:hypothetical protein [Bacteriovorax sp. DB6_IX]EQC50062.1 putative lipoprotein [Bacteriovorax sp. DB6_IX]